MKKQKLVSIIVPIYNVEKYLSECIDSILRQSYDNLEIILVNDGATDSCGLICDRYACKDKRIVVLHKENGGLSDARNAGLSHAHGKYIAFVDSDDYIEADMISELYNACHNQDADIVVCGRRQVWEDGNSNPMFCVDRLIEYSVEQAIEQILLNGTMDSAAWDKLYKSNLFDNMRYPVGVLHEDVNFTSRLLYKANKVVKIPYIGYNYRMRIGSITKQAFKPQKMDLYYQTKMLCEFVKSHLPELENQAEKYYCFNLTNLMTLLIRTKRKEYRKEKIFIRKCSIVAFYKNVHNQYIAPKDKIRMGVKIIQMM